MNLPSEHQFLCSELVQIIDQNEELLTIANLEEIHRSGATLLAEEPLSPGAAVQIQCQDGTLKGSVVSSQPDELGYFVTVQFDGDSLWSREWFAPEHFLDPQEILVRKQKERSQEDSVGPVGFEPTTKGL